MRTYVILGLAALIAPSAPGTAAAPAKGIVVTGKPVANAYHISPGDQLEIYVWGEERLQRSLAVLPDGTFAFPLAGTVRAAGRTPTEVEADVSKLLAAQYKGEAPQVTVSVRQPSGMQVSIIGKVRSPGTLTPTRYVTVLDAVAMAGGPTDFADTSNIVILRREGDHTAVIRARLGGILKGKPSPEDLANVPQLMAGDTVVVP